MNCPKCGGENPATHRFCDTCGTKLGGKEKERKKESPAAEPAAGGADFVPAAPAAALSWTQGWNWEALAWGLVFAVALVLRFTLLNEKPLHHDESMHAFYSFDLFRGHGYAYNPMMHGPFLYHANALIYFLFGASNYTCRIMPALAGMLMLCTVYWLRPHLGRLGGLFAGVLVAISPSFTYFSRFIREDIYMATATILMVYGLFQYLSLRKPKYLYVGVIGLAWSFCTKEATYITGAIFVTLLFFTWLWETTLHPDKELPMASAVKELWKKSRPFWTATAIFFGIVLVLYTTFFTNPQGFVDAFTKSLTYWMGQHEVQRGSQPVYFYAGLLPLYETLITFGALAALAYYGFIQNSSNRLWRGLAYLILAAAWWLFTLEGNESFGLVFSVLLISLGSGMLVYFSLGATDLFVTFLMGWTLATFSDYSFAGERMPWLIVHPLLPMTLLTGKFAGDLWERFRRPGRIALGVAGGLGLALMLHNTSLVNFYGGGANPAELLVYVQSSTDVPQVVKQITNMSRRLTGSLEMKITCEDYCSWPFAWYLREFKNVGYPKYTANQAEGTIEKNPIILSGVEMAAPGHDDRVAQLLAADYVAQRYKLRVWWAPDAQAFLGDTLLGQMKKAWNLILYREPWSGLGSYDMIVYVRKDVANLYWSNAE